MTPQEQIESYKYCLQIMIAKIRQVCDGDITLDQFREWRKGMEEGMEGRELN